MGDYLFTTIAVIGIVIYVVYRVWLRYFQKCEKCGNSMRIDRSYVPPNDESTTPGALFKRPKKKVFAYKCVYCGNARVKESFEYE